MSVGRATGDTFVAAADTTRTATQNTSARKTKKNNTRCWDKQHQTSAAGFGKCTWQRGHVCRLMSGGQGRVRWGQTCYYGNIIIVINSCDIWQLRSQRNLRENTRVLLFLIKSGRLSLQYRFTPSGGKLRKQRTRRCLKVPAL